MSALTIISVVVWLYALPVLSIFVFVITFCSTVAVPGTIDGIRETPYFFMPAVMLAKIVVMSAYV